MTAISLVVPTFQNDTAKVTIPNFSRRKICMACRTNVYVYFVSVLFKTICGSFGRDAVCTLAVMLHHRRYLKKLPNLSDGNVVHWWRWTARQCTVHCWRCGDNCPSNKKQQTVVDHCCPCYVHFRCVSKTLSTRILGVRVSKLSRSNIYKCTHACDHTRKHWPLIIVISLIMWMINLEAAIT